jgi:hypothetical protein
LPPLSKTPSPPLPNQEQKAWQGLFNSQSYLPSLIEDHKARVSKVLKPKQFIKSRFTSEDITNFVAPLMDMSQANRFLLLGLEYIDLLNGFNSIIVSKWKGVGFTKSHKP